MRDEFKDLGKDFRGDRGVVGFISYAGSIDSAHRFSLVFPVKKIDLYLWTTEIRQYYLDPGSACYLRTDQGYLIWGTQILKGEESERSTCFPLPTPFEATIAAAG